jgi:hypothetical protein
MPLRLLKPQKVQRTKTISRPYFEVFMSLKVLFLKYRVYADTSGLGYQESISLSPHHFSIFNI